MGTAIRTRVVKIGNSQGVRIPKLLLEQSGIHEAVEIEIRDSYLVLRAVSQSRAGWEEAFATMAEQQDDKLLDDVMATTWDDEGWEW
ncbi:MAG: AbrB/MazE/SpoVT family DNA-binding domain-containing protein [Elainellaceae cyanobacterium]